MLVVFDTQFVALLLHPRARVPDDPNTGKPVTNPSGRIALLVETLEAQGATILIPTPALAEFLVLAQRDGPAYLSELKDHSALKVEPFDEMAAIEAAAMEIAATDSGDKRGGAEGDWQKVKVDRQILAVAKTRAASCVYSVDPGMVKMGNRDGINIVQVHELPLPPAKEGVLDFETTSSTEPQPPSGRSPDVE